MSIVLYADKREVLHSRPIAIHCLHIDLKNSQKAKEFFKGKDTISDFEDKFYTFGRKKGLEPGRMTFQEKFELYKKDFPNYEVWDYSTIIPFKLKREAHGIAIYNWIISTSGKIWNLVTNEFLTPYKNNQGYLRTNNLFGSFLVHRLVMSTFCSDIKREGPGVQALTVNHKDTVTINNDLLNLEWLTELENTMEMSDRLGLSKPLKATATIKFENVSIGDVFYLEKRSDVKHYGGSRHFFGSVLSKSNSYKGFIFEDCEMEDLEGKTIGFPDSVALHLFDINNSISPPLKITLLVNIGDFKKGETIYFPRRDRFKCAYFVYRTLRKVIASNKPYLGCLWENTILARCIGESPERQTKLFDALYRRRIKDEHSSLY